jgi:signal transduction histidine kinase
MEDEEPVVKAVREGISTRGQEVVMERADGTRRYVMEYAEPIQDVTGHRAGAVHMMIDLTARREAELRLAEVNQQLRDVSRQAGMAEVATNVLHNVGNVLNSANVSLEMAVGKVQGLRSEGLSRLSALVQGTEGGLPALAETAQGAKLPGFLAQLAEHFAGEKAALGEELDSLRNHLEHINRIVAMQQDYAVPRHVLEKLPLGEVIEDALRLNSASLDRHGAEVVRDFDSTVPVFPVDRHKLIQVLVNLIQNAKQAMAEGAAAERKLTLATRGGPAGRVRISISDTGMGIPRENLGRLFEHGFTTRQGGHGFGLHASALAAREMGGTLTVASGGLAQGATFTLELPLQPRLS